MNGSSSKTPFPSLAAVAPCAAAALCLWGTQGGAASIRARLSAAPVVFVDRISYFSFTFGTVATKQSLVTFAPTSQSGSDL